jgi:hypothetical protein
LARFSSQEFASLLVEILIESQRRLNLAQAKPRDHESGTSDSENHHHHNDEDQNDEEDEEEDPLYDKVPSDEDYASVASESSTTVNVPPLQHKITKNGGKNKSAAQTTTYVNVDTQTIDKYGAGVGVGGGKRSHSESSSPLKHITHQLDRVAGNKSPPLSSSSSSESNRSPKPNAANNGNSTPSPTNSKCKILNTKFDKPVVTCGGGGGGANASSLVANAESTLNSIINSLNQIDYSHLGSSQPHPQHATLTKATSFRDNGVTSELKSENDMMKAMVSG